MDSEDVGPQEAAPPSTAGSTVSSDDFEQPPGAVEPLPLPTVEFGPAEPERQPECSEPEVGPEIDITSLSVGERLYYVGCGIERSRQQRLRTERQLGVLKEVSLLSSPQITAMGRRAYTGAGGKAPPVEERIFHWQSKYKRNAERRLADSQQQADDELSPKRHVNAISDKMVGPKYSGPVRGWAKHAAKHQARKSCQRPPERCNPTINASADWARRGAAPVDERLFADAAERADRRQLQRQQAELQSHVDPLTQLPRFTPNVVRTRSVSVERGAGRSPARANVSPPRRSHSADRPQWRAWASPPQVPGASAGWDAPVSPLGPRGASPAPRPRSPGTARSTDAAVHSLLSRGQQAQHKREQRKLELDTKRYSFTPRLNPDSLAAAKHIHRTPLHCPRREVPAAPPKPRFSGRRRPEEFEEAASRSRSAECPPDDWALAFLQRNAMLAVRRRERVDELKQQIAQQELRGCTFTPQLCRASDGIRAGKGKGPAAATRSRTRSPSPPRQSRTRSPAAPTQSPVTPPPAARSPRPLGRPPLSPPRVPDAAPVQRTSPRRQRPGAGSSAANADGVEREVNAVLESWRRMASSGA
eukprot:TRINITY_DN19105_c0_g1_i2.p1 TRINITY_DN19105_c0_g1~~TRINITY_DN19105_c0_g1_i2.p1  ORF type:complete len:588 (+),score=161.16 TRINITY_DN19105_c0_g1_i2:61-1824(+)